MRVALLAAASSIHTVRWANGLAGRGLDVHLLSAHPPAAGIDARVTLHRLHPRAPAAYLLAGGALARRLGAIAPDLLNAHYASGYGLLARRSGFQPSLLSVWGSDVYDFPRRSPLHRALLRANLRAAGAIASTSRCMAAQAARIWPHPRVFLTPFGVDETRFVPGRDGADDGTVVVGTVKALTRKYGVDLLISAFARAAAQLEGRVALRLEIGGGGPEAGALRRQARALGVADRVHFHGPVAHAEVPALLRRLDVFAALSRYDSESFGVAAVEAAACAKPVLVSDVAGFVEVLDEGRCGVVVPREDATAAAAAIVRLATDPALRRRLGAAARDHVLAHYTWERSLDAMIAAYEAVAGRSVETHE